MTALIRMNGNRLKELDRFLFNLLDAILLASGQRIREYGENPPADAAIRKLSAVQSLLGMDFHALARLRALMRIASALGRQPGEEAARQLRADIRIASGQKDIGKAIDPRLFSESAILGICEFYQTLGDNLVAALPAPGAIRAHSAPRKSRFA